MAGKDEKRVRSKTISFYVTPEENQQIQARIKIAGIPKGEYFIESLLHQKICISVGKYQSDRLSLEMKKLRLALENINDVESLKDVIDECKALLEQLKSVTDNNSKLSADIFNSNSRRLRTIKCFSYKIFFF